MSVKEFWKSVKKWQSYSHEFGVFLFWDTVYKAKNEAHFDASCFLWSKPRTDPAKPLSCLLFNFSCPCARFVLVVILCGSEQFIRDFVLMAHQQHMTAGEYVYVVAAQVPPRNVHTPWVSGVHDDEDETARLAFESVLQVRLYQLTHFSSVFPK